MLQLSCCTCLFQGCSRLLAVLKMEQPVGLPWLQRRTLRQQNLFLWAEALGHFEIIRLRLLCVWWQNLHPVQQQQKRWDFTLQHFFFQCCQMSAAPFWVKHHLVQAGQLFHPFLFGNPMKIPEQWRIWALILIVFHLSHWLAKED